MWALIKKWAVLLVVFLLPWQTRYIWGSAEIGGHASEFAVYSVYAVQVLVLILAIILITPSILPLEKGEGRIRMARPLLFKEGMGVVSGVVMFFIYLLLIWAFGFKDIYGLVHIGYFASALILLFLLQRSDISRRDLSLAFGAGLFIPIVFGIYQFFVGSFPASTILGIASRESARAGDSVFLLADGARLLRAYGTFPHPNIFAGYLVIAILAIIQRWQVACLAVIVSARQDCELPTANCQQASGIISFFTFLRQTPKDLLIFALLGMLIIGLIFTGSSSAWLALGVGTIFALVGARRRLAPTGGSLQTPFFLKQGWEMVIGVSVILLLFSPFVLEYLGFNSASITERTQFLSYVPSVINNYWLTGVGSGQYVFALADAITGLDWWMYQPVHNTFLLIFAEVGLIGLMGLIGLIGLTLKNKIAEPMAISFSAVLIVLASFDHYLWSSWAGLALCAFVLALNSKIE